MTNDNYKPEGIPEYEPPTLDTPEDGDFRPENEETDYTQPIYDPESENAEDDYTQDKYSHTPQHGDFTKLHKELKGLGEKEAAGAEAASLAKGVVLRYAIIIIGIIILVIAVIAILYFFFIKYPADCTNGTGAAKEGPVIVVDPGHVSELPDSSGQADYDKDKKNWENSGHKSGANDGAKGNGLEENKLNQQVSEKLKKELESRGHTVYITKNQADDFMTNLARGNFAKEKKASLYVRVHNDGDGPSAGNIFYYPWKNFIKKNWNVKNDEGVYVNRMSDEMIAENKKLAKTLNESFKESAKEMDARYQDNNYYPSRVAEQTNDNRGFGYTFDIPTALIEMSSLQKDKDAEFIKKATNQEKLAKAYADGIEAYLNQKDDVSPSVTTSFIKRLFKAKTSLAENASPYVGPGDDGSPLHDGYYQLPENPAYDLNANGGSPRDQQWGKKDLIDVIITVLTAWNSAHPDQRMAIGDLNAYGHASHRKGVDVDIYSKSAVLKSLPGHSPNSNYDPKLAVELGKMFVDTGVIQFIGYSDCNVLEEINKYAASKDLGTSGCGGTPGRNWGGHDDHFHVRIKGSFKGASIGNFCPTGQAAGQTGENGPIPGKDYQAVLQEVKTLINEDKLTFSHANDKNGLLADGKVRRKDGQDVQIDVQVLRLYVHLVKNKGHKLNVSSMIGGHDKFSSSGNVSKHWTGQGIDFNQINGNRVATQRSKEDTIRLMKDLNSLVGSDLTPRQVICRGNGRDDADVYNLSMNGGAVAPGFSLRIGDHTDHVHIGY